MQYFTVVDNTYEEAIKKAKELYGDNIRIHSRRDFVTHGGLFTRKQHKCEISCYCIAKSNDGDKRAKRSDLAEFEMEAKTPDPSKLTLEERLDTNVHRDLVNPIETSADILIENYISGPLMDSVLNALEQNPKNDVSAIAKQLVSLVPIAYEEQIHPSTYMVLIGPTGSGKTTSIAKSGYLYKRQGKKVAIITLDSYRVGAYEQIKAFGDALDIPVDIVRQESELLRALEHYSWYDLVLIDTMGLSLRDKNVALRLKGLTSMLDSTRTSYIFTASPSMKEEDLIEHYLRYKDYSPKAMICTKVDETETIGNVLSFCYKMSLPLLFLTDGQKVPDDIIMASSTAILPYLKDIGYNSKDANSQLNMS